MSSVRCKNCHNKIDADLDFCPYCGELLIDDVNCINDPDKPAEGVCLICEDPFCKNCGGWVRGKFFCNEHSNFEIYEGMAKVFSSQDYVVCTYVMDTLLQGGIHPYLYDRKSAPLHFGVNEYGLFMSPNKTNEKMMNEVKVMVPFAEFLEAKNLLDSLQIS